MVITEATRRELKALISQTLDEREQQSIANKYVYRRICEDFEQELNQFDYTEPTSYIDSKGVQQHYDKPISCVRRIQDTVSLLLRIIYQVKVTANLPAEKEADMRHFMSSLLGLMAELRNQNQED